VIYYKDFFYEKKTNWASNCLNKCGDNWITEDLKIDFPPAGDTERLDAK
jgi:hypothetical protein